MTGFSRRSFLGLTALTAAGALSACGSEKKPPKVDPGPKLASPTPELTGTKLGEILTQFAGALEKADAEKNGDLLAPRVSGSAAEFRRATYDIIAKVPEHESALQRPSDKLVVPISSTTEGFPRYALALVDDAANAGEARFFVGLEQKDARSDYTSWGWARQAAGIEMPTVPSAEAGTTQVNIEDKGLVLTPKEALAKYAAVLTDGHDNADPDDLILEDPFQQSAHAEIQGERAQMNEGVDWDEVASVREEYAVKEGEFLGLATAEGGAVIMGTLTSTRRVSVNSGSISYSEDNLYTKLAGTKKFEKELVRTYGTTVLLHIPAKDSGAKVQPIGAYKVLLSVSGS